MNTKYKGDIALGQAIAYYTKNEYEVLLPIGDKRHYDFVIEKNGVLQKVQVKYAGMYASGICKVGLRITGGNQKINYSRKYANESFDVLFVYSQKGEAYHIPWNEVSARNELTIEVEKYIKYRVPQ